MKKSLVLAMAMALGITVSAHAANPFSDVPAGHWAYDSVAKLAAAGVVDGYPDGTFRGDRLMTRYEMAQIIAKAMAKGANVDRLAAEFAEELDALGVRVAALEKKADNVKITGQLRYSLKNDKDIDGVKSRENKLRSRLFFNGDVNKNWKYVGMIQNNQDLINNKGDESVSFKRAYLEGRLGGMEVTAGNFAHFLADGNVYDANFDGIAATYGSKVKVGAYYGKPSGMDSLFDNSDVKFDRSWGANASTDLGKLNIAAGFDRFERLTEYDAEGAKMHRADEGKLDIWNAGMTYDFGEASLGAMYLHSNVDAEGVDHDGFVITGTVKGAEAAKAGSWGLEAKYYDQGVGTAVAHTMDGDWTEFAWTGFKGYKVEGAVTVAKNMVATVAYYDLKSKVNSDDKNHTLWSELSVTF